MDKSFEDFKESIMDSIICPICLETIQNSVMCPNCKKFCCESCIKVNIEELLHFRNGLTIIKLVHNVEIP